MAEKTIKNLPYFVNEDTIIETKDENGKVKKTIKYKTSLVQEVNTFIEDENKKVRETTDTVVLIDNIWDDLKSPNGKGTSEEGKSKLDPLHTERRNPVLGTWRRIGRRFFYWDVEVSVIGGDGEVVKQRIEAPTPQIEIFIEDGEDEPNLEESESDSAWSKYWKNYMKTSIDNSEYTSAITPKEDVIHETTTINQKTEETEVVPEKRIEHPVDQTIETLISTLF